MATEMDEVMEEPNDEIVFARQSLEWEQFMSFKRHDREYIYARHEDEDYLLVPSEEQKALEKLLIFIREFEGRVDELEVSRMSRESSFADIFECEAIS